MVRGTGSGRQHVLGVCLGGFIGHIGGVGFRRHGQVNYGVAQMYITFGHSQKMTGLVGRHCQRQCLTVRHPYVLAGKTDQPAGHIQRILPSQYTAASGSELRMDLWSADIRL